MLDAQQRSANRGAMPYKRVSPDISAQTRPAAEPQTACSQNAPKDHDARYIQESTLQYSDCTQTEEVTCPLTQTGEPQTGQVCQAAPKRPPSISSEELLIIALLLLTLSEGGNMPLVLALLYLLM